MSENNLKGCSIKNNKVKGPVYFIDENSSHISTSMNIFSKEQKTENNNVGFYFQSFLNSKQSAFQFAPIFGTSKNIMILNATTIEEENNSKFLDQSFGKNLFENLHLSKFFSPQSQISDYKSSFNFQTNKSDTLFNEDFLSSSFPSHFEE